MAQQQAETDKAWRTASDGRMRLEKITYRSRAGNLEIPAFVFQPLISRGARSHPALVWVHEDIRGHLYEHYIPYIREATAKATSSSRRNTAAESDTGRRCTTRSTTAAPRSTMW